VEGSKKLVERTVGELEGKRAAPEQKFLSARGGGCFKGDEENY